MDIVDEVVVVVGGGGGGGDGVAAFGDGGGGGVEPFIVVTADVFGDWERERSDEAAVDAITGGINLLVVDDSIVG